MRYTDTIMTYVVISKQLVTAKEISKKYQRILLTRLETSLRLVTLNIEQ